MIRLGKGSGARTVLGMYLQWFGLILLLVGGLIRPSGLLMAVVGLGIFALGFVVYADKNLSARKYLRDWIGCFLVLQAFTTGALFFAMIRGGIAFPASLFAFLLSGLISYALLKLFIWLHRKYAASKKAASTERAAAVAAKTSADGQRERAASVGKVNAAGAQAAPAGKAQSAAPAQRQEESTEAQIAALAAKLKEAPIPPTIQEKRRAPAMRQEEFYGLIDAEAAELPPDEAACYTSEGQALLLKAVVRALPQLEMLCAPGFPGDRLLRAADGAQAYDAMVDLVGGIRDLLKRFSRSQLQETLSGVSGEDALRTWKALRFYEKIMGGEDGFEEVFSLLSEKV